MHFLANENIPLASIDLLCRSGHHVVMIAQEHPGMKDVDVLKRAIRDNSIILTLDRDYGELIFRNPGLVPPGLVYFRMAPSSPELPAMLLLNVLKEPRILLQKHFTVIEPDRVRQRSL